MGFLTSVGDPQIVVLTGAQVGDEGKGATADEFAAEVDLVVGASGGANAGHKSVSEDGVKIVGHLIPSGLLRGKTCVIGRGKFFDLGKFIQELNLGRATLGAKMPRVWVDEACPVWMSFAALFEGALEAMLGAKKIGTTGRAIAQISAFDKLRIGLRVYQLLGDSETVKQQLKLLHRIVTCIVRPLQEEGLLKQDLKIPSPEEEAEKLCARAWEIKPMITDTGYLLWKAWKQGQKMLFELSQATWLDTSFGTWPYVTAGHSLASGALVGTGLPLAAFRDALVLNVAKLLPSRVGAGPFPSEIADLEGGSRKPKSGQKRILNFLMTGRFEINFWQKSLPASMRTAQATMTNGGTSKYSGSSAEKAREEVEVSAILTCRCCDTQKG